MSDNIRAAIIDVGTLKCKFEIKEFNSNHESKTLYKDKQLTVLGRDLQKNDNNILQSSVDETVKALLDFKKQMDQHGVSRYEAITTEAVRKASNAKVVLNEIAVRTGIQLKVMTHDEEAIVFFRHIAKSFPGRTIAVADIGGGSVQLVVGQDENIHHTFLFKTGTYFMQEELSKTHHPTMEEIENARQYIAHEFAYLKRANITVNELVYGSTNIIAFMQAMKINLIPSGYGAPHNSRATRQELEKVFAKITKLSYEERMPLFPEEPYYMWSADNALLNIFGFMDAMKIDSTIPTNENISSGLFSQMVEV